MNENDIDIAATPILPVVPQLPPWEHTLANFDIDYTDIKKDEDPNLLSIEVKSHLVSQYPYHLKVFTDGSVLESGKSGAAFIIPDLKVHKSFHLGKDFAIFTSELFAILMALLYLSSSHLDFYSIVFCVDSRSVLQALKHWQGNVVRNDIVFEIKFLIHCLRHKGIGIDFCWIPSHCGLYWNDLVDSLAKQGALECNSEAVLSNLKLSSYEINAILKKSVQSKCFGTHFECFSCSRNIEIIILKLRLNAWNTKFSKDIRCSCSNIISVHHVLFECPVLTELYRRKGLDLNAKYSNVHDALYDSQPFVISVAEVISQSTVGKLL